MPRLREATGWLVAYAGRPACMNTIANCDDLDRLCLCQVDHLGCLTPDGDFVDIERAQPAETFGGWWFISPPSTGISKS